MQASQPRLKEQRNRLHLSVDGKTDNLWSSLIHHMYQMCCGCKSPEVGSTLRSEDLSLRTERGWRRMVKLAKRRMVDEVREEAATGSTEPVGHANEVRYYSR